MLENERPDLLTMTIAATFIQPCHRQAACGFENVRSMRVVALDTIHPPFNYRVMLGQTELATRLQMALKTGRRVLSGIYNELSPAAAGLHMLTARTVTGF